MVWAGTGKLSFMSRNSVKIVYDGLDADNEETYLLYPVNLKLLGFIPTHAKFICTDAQVGLTYDVALQGSIDATNWTDILTATAKDTYYHTTIDYTAATGQPNPASYIYYRVFAADVTDGAATSHTATVYLFR